MKKIKKNKPKKVGGGILNEKQLAGLGTGAGLAGSLVSTLIPPTSIGGGIASGALSGAASLSALGPAGMAVGALVGGVKGFVGAKKAKKAEAAQKEFAVEQNRLGDAQTMRNGMSFKHGGKMLAKHLGVENGGSLEAISEDAVEVKADNPTQTDSVELDQAFVDHNEVIDKQNRVFSDEVLTPSGKSVAKEARKLEKMKSKNMRFSDANNFIESKLDRLFDYQEATKPQPAKDGLQNGGVITDPIVFGKDFHKEVRRPFVDASMRLAATEDILENKQLAREVASKVNFKEGLGIEEIAPSNYYEKLTAEQMKKLNLKKGGKMGDPTSSNPNEANTDILFQNWYSKNTLEGQRGVPYSDKLSYDYYSFYKNNAQGNIQDHFPDTFKRPTHPTFSNESIYSTPEAPGGSWEGEVFTPHKPTLKQGPKTVKKYAKGGKMGYPFGIPDFTEFGKYLKSAPYNEIKGSTFSSPPPNPISITTPENPFGTSMGVVPTDNKSNLGRYLDIQPGTGGKVLDVLNVAGTFAPNIINAKLQKQLKGPAQPLQQGRVRLDRLDPNAQLREIDRDASMAGQAIKKSTSQAANLASATGSLLAKKLAAKNQVFGQTNAANTQIANQESLVNADITGRNLGKRDMFNQATNEFANRKLQLTSENIANASGKLQAMNRERNMRNLDKDKFERLMERYGELPDPMKSKYKTFGKMGGKLPKKLNKKLKY